MDHFSILSVTAPHRYLSNMLGHRYENMSGQAALHRRRILGVCPWIVGVILFGARFELASFAGCWTKPGCSNDQWEAVYGGSWVLFFLVLGFFFHRDLPFRNRYHTSDIFSAQSTSIRGCPRKRWRIKPSGNCPCLSESGLLPPSP